MIAVNVASWLAARAPGRVLIADLDLQFGQVATHLNLKPQLTVADLARDEQSLREPDLLRTYTVKHKGRLAVPRRPGHAGAGPSHRSGPGEPAPLDRADGVRHAGGGCGVRAGRRSLAVMARAEAVVIPIVPEIGALKALHSLLEYLTEVGCAGSTATFVLNHLFAREMLSMKQIEAASNPGHRGNPLRSRALPEGDQRGNPDRPGAVNSAPARAPGSLPRSSAESAKESLRRRTTAGNRVIQTNRVYSDQ